MTEFAAALAVMVASSCVAALTFAVGRRYIDQELGKHSRVVRLDRPVITPTTPSGIEIKTAADS